MHSEIINFNVGGKLFSALRWTLTKSIRKMNSCTEFYRPNLLQDAILKNNNSTVITDSNGAIFIDRSPECFDLILNYLRVAETSENFRLPNEEKLLQTLIDDAKFFKIDAIIDSWLNNYFDSSILDLSMRLNLIKLCSFKVSQKWSLIYRGSRDGFRAEDFHSMCNGKFKTLTVIRTTRNFIFGGYTDAAWTAQDITTEDENAFVFSLANLDNKPIRMDCVYPPYAIVSNAKIGPIFGASLEYGADTIHIVSEPNKNIGSYATLGGAYTHPNYKKGSSEARSFLAGAYNFHVSNIEVFRKL
jgi:hypothetical protein